MSKLPAQMFIQPYQAWSSYWLKMSQLMWSSGEVVARRGLLYAGSGQAARLSSDFDGMASEKGRAALDAWLAMTTAAMQLAPTWGMRWWASALAPAATPRGLVNQAARAAVDNTAATLRVAQAGMRPVQRQVTSNVRRLKSRKK